MRALIQCGFYVKADDDAHLAAIVEACSAGLMAGLLQRAEEMGVEQEEVDKLIVVLPPVSHIIPDSLEWS